MVSGCEPSLPGDRLREGRPFPAVTLQGLDRDAVTIDAFRGKLLLLNVWATWCAPCRRELPALDRLRRQLDPQHFAMIGLSADSDVYAASEYVREQKVGFANYIDSDGQVIQDVLGVRMYPDTFLISPNGTLLRSIQGERQWDSLVFVDALQQAMQGDMTSLQAL